MLTYHRIILWASRFNSIRGRSRLRFGVAAVAGRDGVAVRTRLGVAEEGADALVELGADDVLELAGLRVRFGVVDGKCVLEKALGESMAANYIAGAARTRWA